AELVLEEGGDVLDRRDEAAEQDRRETVREELADQLQGARQLVVVLALQAFRIPRQVEESTSLAVVFLAGVCAGHDIDAFSALVVEIQDRARAFFVHLLHGRSAGAGRAIPQRRGSRGGARSEGPEQGERGPPADPLAPRLQTLVEHGLAAE